MKHGTQSQYAFCMPNISFSLPNSGRIITGPAIAMISRDEPALVNFPRSAIASGHNAGHIREQPSAINEMNQIETEPGVSTTRSDPMMARMAHIFKAVA